MNQDNRFRGPVLYHLSYGAICYNKITIFEKSFKRHDQEETIEKRDICRSQRKAEKNLRSSNEAPLIVPCMVTFHALVDMNNK